MGIGSGTAMLIGGLASAGGSVASGIMGSNAAQSAAQAQAQAAEQAAQLQYQESQNALGFQQQQWNQTQQNLQPWLQSGTGALSNLNYLMGISPQSPSIYGNPGATLVPNGSLPSMSTPTGGPTPAAPGGYSPPPSLPSGMGTGPSIQQRMASPQAMGVPRATSGLVPVNNGMPQTGTPGQFSTMGASSAPAGSPGLATPGAPMNPALGNPGGATPGGGFGSLMRPYDQTFSAPTAQQMEANDPGYQARMNLGQQAMEQSAAARGNLLTGGTAQAENQLAQDYASNEYNNFYNQSLGAYTTNYNAYNQNQANQFNRLAALAGMGQTTAGQLGSFGQSAANAVSNNLLSTGQMMGQDYQNAGAANASGIVGSANAYGGMASGVGNSISGMMNLSMLQNMLGNGSNPYQALYNAQHSDTSALNPYDPSLTEGI